MKVMQNFITRSSRLWTCTALAVATALVMVGCSAVRLGYNNGETLSYWWLDKYIDVSADQKPWVKKNIAELFGWHRHTQLRDYAQLLVSMQRQVQHPVTPHELQASCDDIKKRVRVLIDHAVPDLAELALALTPAQIAQIEKKFASNNDRYRKDYLSGNVEQRQRFRYKNVMEQAEYWFGAFNREQQALIRRASDVRPLQNEIWLAQRQHRQRELIAILKKIQTERPSRDVTMSMLRTYALTVLERGGGGAHEKTFRGAQDNMVRLMATIINSTTPMQKMHAVKRLQQWVEHFNALAARDNAAVATSEAHR